MSMKRNLFIGVAALSVALLFSSCAKVPQTEIDAATAAIQEAKDAGADLYVPGDFTALTDSMKSVNEAIEAAKAKIFPSYTEVKAKLSVIGQMAVDTKAKSEARQEEIKAEVQGLIDQVNALVEEDMQLVAMAPKGKEGAAALGAIKSEIQVIEGSVTEAQNMLSGGDLIPALDKIKAAEEKAASINAELKEVIAKYSKNRKK